MTDCNESVYNRCKPNVDNQKPAKCPRKRPPTKQQMSNPSYTNNSIRDQYNGHNDPSVQLFVSTSNPHHVAELLETTRKMTRYFKKLCKHNKTYHSNTDSHHFSTNHNNAIHSNNHKCKSGNTNDQVNEIISETHASKNTKSDPEDIKDSHDSDGPDSNLNSSSDSE